MEEKDNKNNLIQITGLWKKTAKSGEVYSSGPWGSVYVSVFKNKKKTPSDDQPDYYLCISPKTFKRKPEEKEATWEDMGAIE